MKFEVEFTRHSNEEKQARIQGGLEGQIHRILRKNHKINPPPPKIFFPHKKFKIL